MGNGWAGKLEAVAHIGALFESGTLGLLRADGTIFEVAVEAGCGRGSCRAAVLLLLLGVAHTFSKSNLATCFL
jgi:hypothetical protein